MSLFFFWFPGQTEDSDSRFPDMSFCALLTAAAVQPHPQAVPDPPHPDETGRYQNSGSCPSPSHLPDSGDRTVNDGGLSDPVFQIPHLYGVFRRMICLYCFDCFHWNLLSRFHLSVLQFLCILFSILSAGSGRLLCVSHSITTFPKTVRRLPER